MIKTRGSATGNAYSGGQSHTMMIERFDGYGISTIEGNRGDQVGARQLDLRDPAHTGQIIFLTRMGTQFYGDPSTPAPDTAGISGLGNRIRFSGDMLVGTMHAVNGRLVEIDASMGWIASADADASVLEWQGRGGGSASEH